MVGRQLRGAAGSGDTMTTFVYIRNQSWSVPCVQAQIIHDEEMNDYKVRMKSIVVLKKFKLKPEEEGLSINQLCALYPYIETSSS